MLAHVGQQRGELRPKFVAVRRRRNKMANDEVKILRLSVREFLEKLESGEIAMAPVPEPYPYSHFKEKNELSANEWQQLIEETDYLCGECACDLPYVGGTRSSARVRRAKAHLETLNILVVNSNGLDVLDFVPLIHATDLALTIAKGSLAKHNAQPRKFVTFDLETGEPLNEPDHSNVDMGEILESMGIKCGSSRPPNRTERRKLKRRGSLH